MKPCILPWVNLCTNTVGRTRPCGYSLHKSKQKLQNSTIASEFNNDIFKQVRKDFLQGKWPENCQRCEYMEKANPNHSKRLEEEWLYEEYGYTVDYLRQITDSDGQLQELPKQLDIRLGNVCNLKCIHCGTGSSSKWMEDKNLLDKYENTEVFYIDNSWIDRPTEIWENIYKNINNVKKFNFQGGEPFASKQHNRFIKEISETKHASDIILHYVTNGTLLNRNILSCLKKFKHVTISVSLDAVGKQLEYYRYPTVWTETKDKLNLLQIVCGDSPNIDLGIQWSCSNVSIFYLKETLTYCRNNLPSFKFIFGNFVDKPVQMNAQNLPVAIKDKVISKLNSFGDTELKFYIDHMMKRDLWPEYNWLLKRYFDDLKIARGIDYQDYLAEMNLDKYFG